MPLLLGGEAYFKVSLEAFVRFIYKTIHRYYALIDIVATTFSYLLTLKHTVILFGIAVLSFCDFITLDPTYSFYL